MEEATVNLEMLDPGDAGNYEERSQKDACIGQELPPAETSSYHDGAPGEACIEQEISPAQTTSNNEGSQGEACIGQELSPEEADLYNMLSDRDEYTEDDLSQEDIESYQEISDWEVSPEQALSQPRIGISQSVSDWDKYSEHALSHGDFSVFQEVSDWEQSIGQGLFHQEDTIAQKALGENARRPSMQSTWESDGAQDLVQHGWEENIGHKALLHEEDEWDEISFLELPEDQERRHAGLAGRLSLVPVPREVWIEDGASELYPWWLLCASPPHVEALASLQEQVPEAETLSQQRGPRKKRLSQLRRALRGLFRCSCRGPRPQDYAHGGPGQRCTLKNCVE